MIKAKYISSIEDIMSAAAQYDSAQELRFNSTIDGEDREYLPKRALKNICAKLMTIRSRNDYVFKVIKFVCDLVSTTSYFDHWMLKYRIKTDIDYYEFMDLCLSEFNGKTSKFRYTDFYGYNYCYETKKFVTCSIDLPSVLIVNSDSI